MLDFFIYLSVVLFVTWVIQKMKFFDYFFVGSFLEEMRKCKICLGYWVSLGAYFVFGAKTFTEIKWIDAALVALLVDYIAYYISEGILRNHGIVRI